MVPDFYRSIGKGPLKNNFTFLHPGFGLSFVDTVIMQTKSSENTTPRRRAGWIPLSFSASFLLRHVKLLAWSLLLVLVTGLLTWLGYQLAVDFIGSLTGHFFQQAPAVTGIRGWFLVNGWFVLKMLFLFVSRMAAFYLAFLVAYCATTPGYIFLSTAVEKIYAGSNFQGDEGVTAAGVITDLLEGCKIGAVGILVTVVALFANFIPVVGQVIVFLIYTFYSALMFVDYPASRHRWSLGRKINWVRKNYRRSFRLGILPALLSMIPLLNIFFMALLFPLFTVHTTLNFVALQEQEQAKKRK